MKNIKLSKFILFPVQMRDSSIIHALSWIFMKKYQTFKIRSFPCSDARFKYYSCGFMNFHEKYQTFKVHPFTSSDVRFKYYSCAFINFHEKYQTFKVRSFPSSDLKFKYYSCAFINFHEKISKFQISPFSRFKCEIQVLFMRFHEFSWKKNFQSSFFPSSDLKFKYYLYTFMNFHEKISNFQSWFFSKFRCEIQVFVMRFHEFSCKNIKHSNFTLFPVQMWDSSIIHALSWIFMKKKNFQSSFFPSSDLKFKYYLYTFMNFHEKISNFQSSFFSQFRCEIQVLFMRFHQFSWKNINFSKFVFFLSSDVRFNYYSCALMNFHEKYQTFKICSFPCSDARFKYLSCAFMNFHVKISNFQSSFSS
jgi:hypothetical protein